MKHIPCLLTAVSITVAGFGLSSTASAEEAVLRAVTFTPAQAYYAKSFQSFADQVNEKGKGVVRIEVIGGPEVVPPLKLGEAQMNGVADIFNLPAGLYLNLVPEGEVFAGSNHTPMENRANGGFDMVNEVFKEKGNAVLLAHVDGGAPFHIFLTKEPKLDAEGNPDLTGLKIRTAPLYRSFVESLGAVNVVQSPSDVYTSLERGVVDGTGYTVLGFRDFNWDKFTKYRIDPGFFQTDVLISMNKDSWDKLSPEAQAILEEVAISYEKESYEAVKSATEAEDKALRDGGMEIIELKGAAREKYLDDAYTVTWERLKSRDDTHYDALREKFFTEGTN
ncbi:TRAP transporter substrate-binding protein DctP [Microbaculum marinum]|uniref:TRAP transporter substrate-binding protein DctP n=1 Tax=Microbaculum marinum TaxID=1764581 RepID=A0AAW9RSE1_9HYPH